jgi:hypothetical protein
MGERATHRRRVLVEDARRAGQHLRGTWHPDERQFVISTWNRDVCTAATRLDVDGAAALAGLLVDGMADAASPPVSSPSAAPATRPGLPGLLDRLRWLVRGTEPGAPRPRPSSVASVRPMRRDSA